MMSTLHGILHGIKWIMFHGHLDYFFKNHLLDRPNNQETLALQNLRTIGLFYFIMYEDPHD